LFKSISLDTMKAFLTKFTSFHTRYYRSQSGRDSQVYLLEHLKELHKSLNPKAKLTFREFQHEWIQKTIIVRWEPETKGIDYKDEEVVILSAHQVSVSLSFLGKVELISSCVLCRRTLPTLSLSSRLPERTTTLPVPSP
jgi:leucyl aminopeptidase